MKHYYFIENESGEEFLVGASNYFEAEQIALEIADDIAIHYAIHPDLSFEYEMTDEEAENSGLDEY